MTNENENEDSLDKLARLLKRSSFETVADAIKSAAVPVGPFKNYVSPEQFRKIAEEHYWTKEELAIELTWQLRTAK